MNRERLSSYEHDQALSTHYDELDPHEPVVFQHSLENVEVIVKSASTK